LNAIVEARHIGLVCFIADPFDPPGHERFGGGHLFLFDLGRFLVNQGFRVTYFTRRNSSEKPLFDQIGPMCSIVRLEIGPAEELAPPVVGSYLDELSSAFEQAINERQSEFSALHSHYWIAGEVVRRFCVTHHVRHVHSILSLGRVNREKGEPLPTNSSAREWIEIQVINSADAVIAVCPSELADLQRLYPEVDPSKVHIIPYGVDPDVFYPRPQSESDFVRRQAIGFPQGPTAAS
jgi:D-inositol-3-phosphate glycosyltransferase